MEAASARMAARDRYGAFGEAPTSQLQRFICTILFRIKIPDSSSWIMEQYRHAIRRTSSPISPSISKSLI